MTRFQTAWKTYIATRTKGSRLSITEHQITRLTATTVEQKQKQQRQQRQQPKQEQQQQQGKK